MVLDASQIPSAVIEHFSAGWQKEEHGAAAIIGFFMVWKGKSPAAGCSERKQGYDLLRVRRRGVHHSMGPGKVLRRGGTGGGIRLQGGWLA
jgi:hypothetical protein